MTLQNSIICLFVVLLAAFLTVVPQILAAVPPAGCSRRCGEVDVPYPFGMEDEMDGQCYLKRGFNLTCNDSFSPPKPFLNYMEVISINLSSAHVIVFIKLSYNCYGYGWENGTGWAFPLSTPYTLSSEENVFTAVGCETLAMFRIGGNKAGGCISGCNSLSDAADGSCTGIGCCQGSIPRGVSTYFTGFFPRSNTSKTFQFNPCSYSFVSQKGNYSFRKSDLETMDKRRTFPVVLDFSMENETCEEAKTNTSSYACVSSNSECVESANGKGYVCNCSRGYQGNPYIPDGCQDIDECLLSRELYPCYGICTNVPGSYICTCPDGYNGYDPRKTRCMLIPGKAELTKLAIGGLVMVFFSSILNFSINSK